MESENNGQPGPSREPDFEKDLKQAQASGDFDYVIETARKTKEMLVNFRDAIRNADFPGSDAAAVAMGLNFLDNMVANSQGQMSALKQAEKQTRDALKRVATQPPQDPANG